MCSSDLFPSHDIHCYCMTFVNDLYQNKDKGHTIIENIAGWEDNKKSLRIDYIFANEKLEVLDSKVIFDKERVSDHFGVMVKVKI